MTLQKYSTGGILTKLLSICLVKADGTRQIALMPLKRRPKKINVLALIMLLSFVLLLPTKEVQTKSVRGISATLFLLFLLRDTIRIFHWRCFTDSCSALTLSG